MGICHKRRQPVAQQVGPQEPGWSGPPFWRWPRRNTRLGIAYCTQHSGGPAEDSDPLILADPGACLGCGYQTYRADALRWVCRASGPQQRSLDDVAAIDVVLDEDRAAAE